MKLSKVEILTEKLRLKPVEKSDAVNLINLRTNPEVTKYINRDLDISLSDIQNSIDKWRKEIYFYTITTLENNEFTGTICLWNINQDKKYAELGYELLPTFQNKGIMTNAIKLILDHAFNQLYFETIEAFTHEENLNSIKLLEKIGFNLVENRIDEGNLNNVIYEIRKGMV